MRKYGEPTLVKLVGIRDGRSIATGTNDSAGGGAGGRITAILEGVDGRFYGKRLTLDLTPADVTSADAFKKAFDRSGYAAGYDLDPASLKGVNLPWHDGRGEGNSGRIVKPVDGAITDWSESRQAGFTKGDMTDAQRRELLSLTELGRATLRMEDAKRPAANPAPPPPAPTPLTQTDLDNARASLSRLAGQADADAHLLAGFVARLR
jgi:hypothetical protein